MPETGVEHGSVPAPSARCHDGGRHGGAVVDLLARPASGAGYLHVPCRLFGRPVAFLELCIVSLCLLALRDVGSYVLSVVSTMVARAMRSADPGARAEGRIGRAPA